MATHVALLRGINVGGKNKLPMKDLVALFEAAGATSVRTYIASGNVVFSAPARVARAAPDVVRRAIKVRFGLEIPVVQRTAAELEEVVRGRPFDDEASLFVMFLAEAPSKAQVASLDVNRSPGDSFVVRGREIYLSLTTGAAKTKLTNAYFDAKLGTISTARNWRTVLTLRQLSQARA